MLLTKHFGFSFHRIIWELPAWYKRHLVLGFGDMKSEYGGGVSYEYGVSWEFWLLPNFRWYLDDLGVEQGNTRYHARIIGIQSWPCRFSTWKRSKNKGLTSVVKATTT